MGENCVKGTENEQRIIALERDMSEVRKDIRDIKETLLGRPTWLVTFLLGGSWSLAVGLLVAFIRVKAGH